MARTASHLASQEFSLNSNLDLQMCFCQALSGLFSVFPAFFLAGELSLQAFELLLGFAILMRVLDGVTFRVGIVGFESYVDADLLPSWDMRERPISLDTERHRVAIGSSEKANPLDLFEGKGFDVLFLVPDEPKSPDATAIGEGDVFARRRQFPAGLLVLHASVIMLELGIALLAWLVHLAVLVEPLNSKPGTSALA
jgi:hypothetical protein